MISLAESPQALPGVERFAAHAQVALGNHQIRTTIMVENQPASGGFPT